MISVGVRLAAFNLKQIANLTCTDELDLYSIGEKKVALFCCIPDADTSMNYLVGMIYSNLFQTLYYVADRKYGGRLPIPVHCIMDEWCCTIKVDIENSKGQYIEKDKQEATKDGSESTKIQHGI